MQILQLYKPASDNSNGIMEIWKYGKKDCDGIKLMVNCRINFREEP